MWYPNGTELSSFLKIFLFCRNQMNTFGMTEATNELNEAITKKGQPSGPRSVGKFSADEVQKLLKMPRHNLQYSKAREMNRSRKNLVFSQSDIEEAINEIRNLITTKAFDLSKYQRDLTFGNPDQVIQARKKLRVLGTVLIDIQQKTETGESRMRNALGIRGKAGIAALLSGSLGMGSVVLVTGLGFLTIAAGTVIMPGVGFALVTPAVAWAVYKYKKLKKAYPKNTDVYRAVLQDTKEYDKKMNLNTLLEVILQVLSDDAKVPADQRFFNISYTNLSLLNSPYGNLQGPENAEQPNASSLPMPNNENWEDIVNTNNNSTKGGKRRKTRKNKKTKKGTRRH